MLAEPAFSYKHERIKDSTASGEKKTECDGIGPCTSEKAFHLLQFTVCSATSPRPHFTTHLFKKLCSALCLCFCVAPATPYKLEEMTPKHWRIQRGGLRFRYSRLRLNGYVSMRFIRLQTSTGQKMAGCAIAAAIFK